MDNEPGQSLTTFSPRDNFPSGISVISTHLYFWELAVTAGPVLLGAAVGQPGLSLIAENVTNGDCELASPSVFLTQVRRRDSWKAGDRASVDKRPIASRTNNRTIITGEV